jgi:hypothetical protein
MDSLTIVKIVASGTVITGFVWGLVKGFFSIYYTVRETKNTVHLIATNHLPHVQESLNRQDTAITEIKGSVQQVENRLADHVTRFEDTKKFVDKINESLIQSAVNHIQDTKD